MACFTHKNAKSLPRRWRILCLIGVLVSFCLLFVHLEIDLKPAQLNTGNYYLNYYSTSPLVLQISSRPIQPNLLEAIKQKRISPTILSPLNIKNYFDSERNHYLENVRSLNVIFQGNLQQSYLLLDTPPPPA